MCEKGLTCPYLQSVAAIILLPAALSLILGLTQAAPNSDEKQHTVIFVDDYADDYGLMCHSCYRSVHGDDCISMTNRSNVDKQLCDDDQTFCVTESLHTDDELTTFTRGCSRSCDSGCETAGDLYKLERCFTCCKSDFCNGEPSSSADSRQLSRQLSLFVALVIFMCAFK